MTTTTTNTLYDCPLKMGNYTLQCSCVPSLGRLMGRSEQKCPSAAFLAVLFISVDYKCGKSLKYLSFSFTCVTLHVRFLVCCYQNRISHA